MIKNISRYALLVWKSKTFQILLSVGSIIFVISILAWLIFSQWDALISHMINIRPAILIISFLIYSVILLLTSGIWAQIMNKLGHSVPFKKHFITFCLSALGKRLPGTIWYVGWRANLYQDEGYSTKLIVLTSGIEIVITMIAAIVVSLIFSIPMILQFNYSIIGFIIIIIASLILLHPKINQKIFLKLNIDFSKFSYKDILIWTCGYIIIWILVGCLLFSFANFYTPVGISAVGYFIGATALTGVLSKLILFSPVHFGFGEISLSLLLAGVMPASLAVIIAITNRIVITFFEILWATFSLTIKQVNHKNNP